MVYKIAAYLLVLLGIVHLALTPVFFRQVGLDVLWFAGMGMGIIFLGNLNLVVLLAHRTAFYLMAITSNIMALLLMGLILSMNPAMQAYIGLGLLLLISVTSIWQYIKLLKEALRQSQNTRNDPPPDNNLTSNYQG